MAIIDSDDEVGKVASHLRAVPVRHFQPEIVIFHIRLHPLVRFGNTAEFALPVTIQNHPVDMAAIGRGLPSIRSGCIEAHMRCRPGWIIGIEHGCDRALVRIRPCYAGGNPVARHIRKLLIDQEGRVGAPLAYQMIVEPLLGNALELPKQV